MRAIAINIGANTNTPGFRGPVYPDGTFEYIPIPESEPTRVQVPTYADLDLGIEIPDDVLDVPVHLDPEFPAYPRCERYTYGDEHGVKAGPLSTLETGDHLLFYNEPRASASGLDPEGEARQSIADNGRC